MTGLFAGNSAGKELAGDRGRGAVRPIQGRDGALDRLRGLAVLLMVADHLALSAGLDVVRLTAGRLAVPLFFVLAGHLASRLSWRHGRLIGLGLLLPAFAPWVDSPNVLLYLGVFLPAVAWAGRHRWLLPLAVVLALTLAANGYAGPVGTGYAPSALLALCCVGALLPRSAFAAAGRLPVVLAWPGRHALSLYVGHVLALTVLL
jgi:hypothetical protein